MGAHRLLLAKQADTLRFALLARTSGWRLEQDASSTGTDTVRWRTPSGLCLTLTQDDRLPRPLLVIDPVRLAEAEAEAAELMDRLPDVIEVLSHDDVHRVFAGAATDAERGPMLPLLAATVDGADDAGVAEVAEAVRAGLASDDSGTRAGAVLAAAYLDDMELRSRAVELASADPEPRIRSLAASVAGGVVSGGPHRITFVAERVGDEITSFAGMRGWEHLGHMPGAEEVSEQTTWRAAPEVEAALIHDIRLRRDVLVLTATGAGGRGDLARIMTGIREEFDTVDLDEALDMLAAASSGPERMLLLTVVVASAPATYHPRFLAVLADLFGDPAVPIRGFATGASIYFPWPETVPLLEWSARHDPDSTVRAVAQAGLKAVDYVMDGIGRVAPVTDCEYHAPATDDPGPGMGLVRRLHTAPKPIEQRLGDDLLWHRAVLPDGFPAGYREIPAEEAGEIVDRAIVERSTDQ